MILDISGILFRISFCWRYLFKVKKSSRIWYSLFKNVLLCALGENYISFEERRSLGHDLTAFREIHATRKVILLFNNIGRRYRKGFLSLHGCARNWHWHVSQTGHFLTLRLNLRNFTKWIFIVSKAETERNFSLSKIATDLVLRSKSR